MCWKQSTDKEEQVMVCLLSIKRSCIRSHLLVGLNRTLSRQLGIYLFTQTFIG